MELTKDQMQNINSKCPSEQGVFFQPYGIPVDVKELVIYSRYATGGMSGGSCFGGTAKSYTNEVPENHMQVLDLVLEQLMPNITYLQYKKIGTLIRNNEEREREYYGNCTDWKIEYIVVSELIKLVESF